MNHLSFKEIGAINKYKNLPPAFALLKYGLTKVLEDQWDVEHDSINIPDRDRQKELLKKNGTFQGRPLYRHGLWDTLAHVLSKEAIDFLQHKGIIVLTYTYILVHTRFHTHFLIHKLSCTHTFSYTPCNKYSNHPLTHPLYPPFTLPFHTGTFYHCLNVNPNAADQICFMLDVLAVVDYHLVSIEVDIIALTYIICTHSYQTLIQICPLTHPLTLTTTLFLTHIITKSLTTSFPLPQPITHALTPFILTHAHYRVDLIVWLMLCSTLSVNNYTLDRFTHSEPNPCFSQPYYYLHS